MRCELCWEAAGRQEPAMFAVSWRDLINPEEPCINMVLCDLCADEIDDDEDVEVDFLRLLEPGEKLSEVWR